MANPSPAPSPAHRLHPSILREYDIRGIVGETLIAADAKVIGRAFASAVARSFHMRNPRIAIARDGRLSSPELAEALMEGLQLAGAQVIDCGIGPTPLLYFATRHLGTEGGVMITGSHNPPTHNGFKMTVGEYSFFGRQIRDLGAMIDSNNLMSGTGSSEQRDVSGSYYEALKGAIQNDISTLNVAWDPGNGAAGAVTEAITKQIAGTHHCINTEIDGTFPNHHPDPSVPENLQQLAALVAEKNCDIGLAFDGDGDRLGVVDDKGRLLSPDHLLMIFARDVLQSKPGSPIIADVKTSQCFFDEVEKLGGKPEMYKTGHSLIKSRMKEVGSPFAGEASGHIFFADRYFGFDDGIYAGLRLLNFLAASKVKLSELVDALPRLFSTPELRIPCADDRKFAVIEEVRERLQSEGADFAAIDGVRVNRDKGWWLLRASNTQAVVNARVEAEDEATLNALSEELQQQLAASGVSASW